MVMGDLGAEVIKVEPVRGDGMRGNVVGSFMGCQRGKRDIAVDLKQPEGLEIALQLVKSADMVHHNMTKGTADRLGIAYEHCKAVKPDILYCNNYMYGAVGPLSHLGGLDPLAQAASGIEWEQGPVAAGNSPLWYRYGHGDAAAALSSALGLLITLFHRQRTGEGQSMWASLFHGSMLYTADSWLSSDGSPSARPVIDTEQLGLGPLYRLYETQDGWLQIAALREEDWPALCVAVRRPELPEDARFATSEAREEHQGELLKILEEAFAADVAVNWRRALDAAGVPSEVAVDTWDGETVLFDDDLVRLGLVTEYEHPLLGRVRQFGSLITFSGTPCKQERAAPMLGQHTREILGELGYDSGAIDDLKARNIVTWPDESYAFPV
jgi:crotonobetainyl-CoA:carnitine CoA-transferase CaiB-like acyl-CoA transferase